jgi:hypothetical protein
MAWFDRSWLGESPAYIHILFNSLAPKAFEFAESFLKPARLPLAGFQKWWALCCPLFKRELFGGNYLPDLKTGEVAPCRFQKLSAQLRDICCPIGAKDLNSPVLKRFQQIQKLLALNS